MVIFVKKTIKITKKNLSLVKEWGHISLPQKRWEVENNANNMTNAIPACSQPLFYYRTGFHLPTGPALPRFKATAAWWPRCMCSPASCKSWDVSATGGSLRMYCDFLFCLLSRIFPVLKPWLGPRHSAKLSPIFSSLPHFEVWFLSYQVPAASWILVPIGCCSSRKHTPLHFS